jgi:hypothetical protein
MLSYLLIRYLTDPYVPPTVRPPIFQGDPDGVVGPVIKLPAGPATPADAIAMRTGGNLDYPVVNAIGHTFITSKCCGGPYIYKPPTTTSLGARFYLLVVHRVGPPEDPAALR